MYGNGGYHYLNFSWPYPSSNTVSEKTLIKMDGGILCCSTFTSYAYRIQSTNYVVLWSNSKINQVILATPSLSATSSSLRLANVVNPYPYQYTLYNSLMTMELMVYNSYQRVGVDTFNQPAWSDHTATSNSVTLTAVSNIYHRTSSNQFHDNYAVSYDFTFTFTTNDFIQRKVTYGLVTFTAGVGQI